MALSEVDVRAAELITQGLRTGLVHPGDKSKDQPSVAIPIPAFRTASMPPEMAEHVDSMARLIGEAVVHLLTSSGISLVDSLEAAVEHPTPPEGTVALWCRCQQPLTRIPVKDQVATLDGPALAAELKAHSCRT